MSHFRGRVQNNVVLLQEGVSLPDGTEVEVRLVERPLSRQEAFDRIRASAITRYVGIDEIIAEVKKEIEERPDHWLS